MADKKITDLNYLPASIITGSDVIAIVDVDAAETKKTTLTDISSYVNNEIPAGLGTSGLGWARYDDGVYTTGSAFFMTGSSEAVLPNNGNYTVETYMNSTVDFYDPTTGKVQMENEGDVYSMVVTFKAKAPNANQTHMDLSLSSTGATPYDRVSRSLVFAKGNDIWENFYESFHFYADADFVANGNQWKITADGGDIYVADVIYFIQRTFTAN